MSRPLNRREFIQNTGVAAALAASCHVVPLLGADQKSPNEKLRLACVGTQARAAANIAECASEDIVAICDVDSNNLDKAAETYKGSRKYRDFRDMLDKEAGKIDAVIVGTPDHCHAPAAAMAMRLGKHTYCEKPVAHTVLEARTLAQLAKEKNLVTQMGTQIHAGDNYRRVVELIKGGAIGAVREVHVWVPVSYTGAKYTTDKPAPATLDWNLWLGPATDRPYTEGAHPFFWRRFWEYGSGGLGDFFCHYGDLVHWALDLKHPTTVVAKGPPPDAVSCPVGITVDYDYPARGDLPPVHLTWYDGPNPRPEIASNLKDKSGQPIQWASGQLFVGDKGMLISDYGRHLLLPEDKFVDYKRPEQSIPKSIGHHKEWLNAIRTNGPTTCNFGYGGALTEAALLGVVAYRSGQRLEWDAANLKVTNSPAAQQLIHKEYRKGWTL